MISIAIVFIEPVYGLYEKKVKYSYSETTTLSELSKQLSIPTSKLKDFLELPQETNNNLSLGELGINSDQVKSAQHLFRKRIWGFSWNIVLVGMLVIFCSLSLTGFFIGLLSKVVIFSEKPPTKPLAVKAKTKKREPTKVKISDIKSRDAGYNAVVAAITALHFHLQEAEEISKMTLSWKREPVSVWKTSGKFTMPNRIIHEIKKG